MTDTKKKLEIPESRVENIVSEQKLIDLLYNNVVTQKTRCDYFSKSQKLTKNSVWNKTNDENCILDIHVDRYKNYYINQAELLKRKLENLKNYNISSYLTYDTNYYINDFNAKVLAIDEYIQVIKDKTIDQVLSEKLSYSVDSVSYMLIPSTLGF